MPARKKTTRASTKKAPVQKPQVSSSMGTTYDTQMIITILLLLFVYPIGLICMWVWMKNWPVWLKLVISIPFLLAVFFIVMMLLFVGSVVRNGRFERMMYQQQYRQMMQNRQQQEWQASPTPGSYNTY